MGDLHLELNLILEPGIQINLDADRIEALAKFALKEAGASGLWEVAIVLTTDERLRHLHRQYMAIDSVTDVMTFPSDPAEGDFDAGGDIVISVDRAAEQGGEFGHTREQETAFLIVHGLLHLCGWKDGDEGDRERMLNYQDQLIQRFQERSC